VNHLLRERAPITEAGWKLLDEEARERLEQHLATYGMKATVMHEDVLQSLHRV